MPPMHPVVRPLNVLGVQKVLEVAKQFYDNNFMSFYLAISGAVMALHCQEVININDECPIVMCYSSSCGTGKTDTLKAIKSLFGDTNRLQR